MCRAIVNVTAPLHCVLIRCNAIKSPLMSPLTAQINNLSHILKMLNCELYVNKKVFEYEYVFEYVFEIMLMNFSILLRVRDSGRLEERACPHPVAPSHLMWTSELFFAKIL